MILIKKIQEEDLQTIKKVLDNDGIIIYPTDTVYGIGCNCYSEKALKKLFSFKNRPLNKPINVLTNSYEKIKKVTKNISS